MKLLNRIKELRFQHDQMSQQALAEAVGVTRMTIYSIEKGKFLPSTLLAFKIARVFGCGVEEVFSLEETEEGNAI
ncbi:MAG: helix-turn-helix transcriptional regulator [Anaerolineae bacterium]|jgi:putative transcriptional regulator|nr:helix-turn-helix transcriptional regulator [Anaerolineae bacterium]